MKPQPVGADDGEDAPRAVLSELKFECNVGEKLHANGGGLDLHDANVHNFIEAVMNDSSGNDISRTEWAISSIADDTGNHDEVQITITASASAPLGGDNPILIGGFTPKTLSPPSGEEDITKAQCRCDGPACDCRVPREA